MKKPAVLSVLVLLTAGCVAPEKMTVQVAPLGEPVQEGGEMCCYTLPQTVLKVAVSVRETREIPGPYRDYAERYLGIGEVIRNRSSQWQIMDVRIAPFVEADPGMWFQIHFLEGKFMPDLLTPWKDRGLILDGTGAVDEQFRTPALESGVVRDYEEYTDLGIESNFSDRTETMYKTIVTDTSFVKVPVNRTITEQKSKAKKAEEAADFILELRTRRFELITGGYDVIPQGEAMEANLKELDKLEQSYLSLFCGRTYSITRTMAWFVVPESGEAGSDFRLGNFSGDLGFVPEDLMEGSPLEVTIEPLGKTRDLGEYYSSRMIPENSIAYRVPDVVKLQVRLGEELLVEKRLSVFQAGALVSAPLR